MRQAGRGDGPTVLFTDGILCDGYVWKYLWPERAARGPVAHWHYRGHGRSGSPKDAARIDIPAHADDLDHVRRALGDPPVVLVGHSMGVQVVLEAYRARPDRVAGLVLLCGSHGRVLETFHGTDALTGWVPKLLRLASARPGVARALWSRVPPEMALKFTLWSGEVDARSLRPGDMRPYLEHATHVDLPLFLAMLRAAGEHSAADLLPHVQVPTLVVAGSRDTFTPARLSEELAAGIPGAELCVLEGGTHTAPLERPDALGAALHRFWSDRIGA